MENFAENKPDNFNIAKPEKQKDAKINFDGELITIAGDAERIKEIVTKIMKMHEENILHKTLKYVLKDIDDKQSRFPFSADILTPDKKMVRMKINFEPGNVIVTLGGGGNSTPPEKMREEIRKATGLEI